MNTLLTSAFLSEMSSEKMIKISHMKIGGSPLYYSPSNFKMLENFSAHLGSKEKEAFSLIKEKKVLQDDLQTPVIRVALRSLKDFALLFKEENKIFWRYFLISEEQAKQLAKPAVREVAPIIETPKIAEITTSKKEMIEDKKQEIIEIKKPEQIFQKPEEQIIEIEKPKILKPRKKPAQKEDFLNEVSNFLSKKGVEIVNIEKFDKKEVTAKVRVQNKECLLIAYNKKKIDNKELLKAYKKSQSMGLPYSVISRGNMSKKTKERIDAYKKLMNFDVIDNSKEVHNNNI
jgi:hypothetical protein